jgi:hypothetical protein
MGIILTHRGNQGNHFNNVRDIFLKTKVRVIFYWKSDGARVRFPYYVPGVLILSWK